MIRSRVTLATIDAAAIAALFVSPSTTARCGGASGPSRKPSTRHASARRREVGEHGAQPPEVRAVEPVAVDVAGGDHAHGDVRRARRARRGAAPRASRARPASSRSGARAAARGGRAAPRSRAGRPRRRAARRAILARLVGARDEAHAEPAVVAEQSLSGREWPRLRGYRVRPRNGFRARSAVAGFVPAQPRRPTGRSRRCARSTSDLPAGVLRASRVVPVAAAPSRRFAAQTKTSVSRSTNHGAGLSGAARPVPTS